MSRSHAQSGASAAFANALFMATLLFYLISTAPFADLTTTSSVDPAADRSNLLNQAVFLALTLGLWVQAALMPVRTLLAQPRALLIMIVVWFTLASVISLHPDIACKRVVLGVLTVLNAGIVLLLPRSERDFARMLSWCCLLALVVAYAGVVLLPTRAIHQAAEIREPMNAGLWRGQFPHKNTAAAAMVVLAYIGLYVRAAGRRAEGLVIFGLAFMFLTQTGGKSSSAALPVIMVLAWMFERWRAVRIPLVIGGVAAFNAVTIGCSVSPDIRAAVAAMGIDPTFTNRIDIWRIATEAIAQRPLTGHGFQLFWQTDEQVYGLGAGASWAVAAFNGHNAYLDTVVTTGLPGLVLTVIWLLVLPLRDIGQAQGVGNSPALTTLFVRIWLYGVFTACVETLFFQSGSLLWFLMLMAVFGIRLQARARGIRRVPAAYGRLAVAHG